MSEQWETATGPNLTHYQKDGRWVKTIARIRLNATGEVREYQEESILTDGDDAPNTFIWADGNYSCDCNRALFFGRANGGEGDEVDCGDGAYAVQLVNPVTGTVFYDEFAEGV